MSTGIGGGARKREPVLKAVGLTKRFGGRTVLHDVTIEVDAGEIVGLIGPNGAGKSTFNACITGELRASEGWVTLNGRDVTRTSAWRRARYGMAKSFQVSRVFADLTVAENLFVAQGATRARALASVLARPKLTQVNEHAAVMGLTDVLEVRAGTLAQGYKKRLELAMALSGKPSLLVLDEPTAGMTHEEARMTADLVLELRERTGVGVLLTEHNMEVIFGVVDRLCVLQEGRLVLTGNSEEVRKSTAMRDIYFGAGLDRSELT